MPFTAPKKPFPDQPDSTGANRSLESSTRSSASLDAITTSFNPLSLATPMTPARQMTSAVLSRPLQVDPEATPPSESTVSTFQSLFDPPTDPRKRETYERYVARKNWEEVRRKESEYDKDSERGAAELRLAFGNPYHRNYRQVRTIPSQTDSKVPSIFPVLPESADRSFDNIPLKAGEAILCRWYAAPTAILKPDEWYRRKSVILLFAGCRRIDQTYIQRSVFKATSITITYPLRPDNTFIYHRGTISSQRFGADGDRALNGDLKRSVERDKRDWLRVAIKHICALALEGILSTMGARFGVPKSLHLDINRCDEKPIILDVGDPAADVDEIIGTDFALWSIERASSESEAK